MAISNPTKQDLKIIGQGLREYHPRLTDLDWRRTTLLNLPSIAPAASLQMNVIVPDESFYGGDSVDFAAIKANGAAGIILRAGQNEWTDAQFVNNWAKARSAGLPRGAYWFLDSRVKGSRQADLMHALLRDDPPELMAVGDYEENYHGPYEGWDLAYDFFERMKALGWTPDRLWIYTGYYYWQDHKPANASQIDYFSQYELWEAWYTTDPNKPLVPPPWGKISLWQFTENNGYGFDVGDLSYFNGSLEEFQTRFNLIPNPGGTMYIYKATPIGSMVNIRADHTTASADIGDL